MRNENFLIRPSLYFKGNSYGIPYSKKYTSRYILFPKVY